MLRILKLSTLVALTGVFFLSFLTFGRVQANVDLLYFRAESGIESITLEWETASEIDNLGFNILRSETGDIDEAEIINPLLIPSVVGGQPIGAYYEWVDEHVEANIDYSYWLQDLDFNGHMVDHGPVEASLTTGNSIPTIPPINTSQPTAASPNTPDPSPTISINPTTQLVQTATATPGIELSPTPVTIQSSATPSPTSEAQSAQQAQEPPSIPTATASVELTSQPLTIEPLVLDSSGTAPVVEELTEPVEASPVAQPLSESSQPESPPDTVAEQSSSSVSAQIIGRGNSQPVEEADAEVGTKSTLNDSTLLALIVLAAALLLVFGAGVAVWLLLKPQEANQDSE
jgi:hypothetical protein